MLPSAGIEMTILPVWLPGRHQPERVDRVVQGELGDGQHLQFAVGDVTQDLLQQPPYRCGCSRRFRSRSTTENEALLASARQPQRGIGVDVLLAEFDEPAAGSQDLHTAPNRLSRQAN